MFFRVKKIYPQAGNSEQKNHYSKQYKPTEVKR